jgi:hypothetical protein
MLLVESKLGARVENNKFKKKTSHFISAIQSGKSHMLRMRVLAGLWPFEEGTVTRPLTIGPGGLFFLPQRPYLTALIGIEEDTVGQWARAKRIPYTTYRDLSEKEDVLRLVQGIIAKVNEATARVENIRKFRMLTKALDHEDGELTATQKVKRSALTKTFEPLIDDMYSGADRLPGGDQSDVIVVAHAEA